MSIKIKEIEITIPSFGGIQVERSDQDKNEALMNFLIAVLDAELHDEIREFFKDEENVELLFGSTSYCG